MWLDWTPPIETSVSQPCSQRIRREVLELAHLVAAVCEARVAVLSLGPDLDVAAKVLGETLESVDRRRAEEQLHAVERFQAHGSSPGDSLIIDCSISSAGDQLGVIVTTGIGLVVFCW